MAEKSGTKDDGKGNDLFSNPDDIFTPHWDWEKYIDKDIVPENHRRTMEEIYESTKKMAPSQSISSLIFDLDTKTTMDEDAMPGLWNVVKYPKAQVVNEFFKMSHLEVLYARWNKHNTAETKNEKLLTDGGIQSMLDHLLNKQGSGGSCYDYEMVFKPMNVVENNSIALFLTKRHKRELSPAEVVGMCIRNFWCTDMEIQSGSKFFFVDRSIFTYFAQNFNFCVGQSLRFPKHKVPMAVIPLIYDWMLTEDKEFDVLNKFIPLFVAAMYLGMRQLLEHYWWILSLDPETGLCETTAFDFFMKARDLGCEEIMPALASKVRKLFIPMVASSEFLSFTAQEVRLLFTQDTICVNCEDEVFFAAVRWFEFDWPNRKKFIAQIMSTIRFQHLSPWLRRSLGHLRENDLIKEISEVPEVTAALWEAAKYCTAWMSAPIELGRRGRNVFTKYLKNKCIERYWVYCPGIPHHHDIRCRRFRELTYNTFKRLLIQVQTQFADYIDSLQFIPNKLWNSFKCCGVLDPDAKNTRTCPRPKWYSSEMP